jgi:hypothetical protein
MAPVERSATGRAVPPNEQVELRTPAVAVAVAVAEAVRLGDLLA